MNDEAFDLLSALSSVRDYLQDPASGPKVLWLGDRVLDDNTVIVFYRDASGDDDIGMFFDLEELHRIDSNTPIEHEVASEISEPSPRYRIVDASWAEGVLERPDRVVWRGIGPDFMPGRMTRVDPPPTGSGQWYVGHR